MKYRLVGARKFLNIATPFTMFLPITAIVHEDKNEFVERVTSEFTENPRNLYSENWGNLHIFIDNNGSVTFLHSQIACCTEEDNYICYYDYNIVGDAFPEKTLYLIIESVDDLPEHIDFFCIGNHNCEKEFRNDYIVFNGGDKLYNHYLRLSREEIIERIVIIKNDLKEDADYANNTWAKEKLSIIDNPVLDIDIEVEE